MIGDKRMRANVVLGVTGGIACYKAADIVSRLSKEDIGVDVIMTEHACQFVQPLTFQTLSKNPVVTDTFSSPKYWEVEHIALAAKADILLIAPATANVIGKIAGGIADDMLSTTVMAVDAKKVLLAPAMNTHMYDNPVVQDNMKKLRSLGYRFIEPGEGLLACGDVGKGRMAEPEDIVSEVLACLAGETAGSSGTAPALDFAGKRILVTAGPTVEDIDPVRYISNRSSGKMGFAVAEAAKRRGAEVTLVAGPVSLQCSEGIRRIDVRSTRDMLEACESVFDETDIVIKAAAPADFYVVNGSDQKIKKQDGQAMRLELAENPDILATLGKKKGSRLLVGFAAETQNLEEYARAKMARKNLDMIVANNVAQAGAGFDRDTNVVTIIRRSGESRSFDQMPKTQVADLILDEVKDLMREKQ